MKTDERLLTLREIADELGVHYRTIIDYKNHFKSFITLKYDGRGMRYPYKYIDFFRLILAMKEEGHSLAVAKLILSDQVQLSADHPFRDWLQEWQDGKTHPGVDGCIHPSVDGGIHPSGDGGTHPSDEEPISRRQHLDVVDATITAISNLARHVDRVQEWINRRQQYVDDLRTRLSELETELGIETRQVQPAPEVADIYSIEIDSLLQSLVEFREELKAEAGEGISEQGLTEDDQAGENTAEPSKGNNPEIVSRDQDSAAAEPPVSSGRQNTKARTDISERVAAAVGSLAIVRDSIENGKPDKNALLEWIEEQRTMQPTLSYTAMASLLDQADIPTLSGRSGWHRGSVRNLAAKNGAG